MPLQNRVTPFGDIVAIAQRGLFTGNRGIIHEPGMKRLSRRRWTTKAWITCLCAFRGRRREVMGGRTWTELFFLDEATAFAAGHRPCFYCRRADAVAFRDAWARGNGGSAPRAAEMDATLHDERLDHRAKRMHPLPEGGLPDGAMLAAGGDSYLAVHGQLLRWSEAGYETPASVPRSLRLLTPPSIVRALAAGYRAVLHPSADAPQLAGLTTPS
jgi:hypothetical protein